MAAIRANSVLRARPEPLTPTTADAERTVAAYVDVPLPQQEGS